ncbi:hypothetical protein B6V01_000915 [Methanosarcinales archaeon ex4572_44]|nr:MAG: hypothetical protein B6U67_04070 [Methanosarcinales archaeon ex4484_138]PHP46062.1 MAG: hypothetical protein B6V01_000915 [Methanosarcinales archaeon ex4572_44]RLG27016.1 MAG: hypothetical protein DRN85_01330 [Methanosarcinales archaeon]
MQIEMLSKKELVNLVLKKHNDLMDRYTQEHNEIGRHEGEFVEEIEREKRERSARHERKEVLEEKKKLLLYQAEMIQKRMFEALLQAETGETKEKLVKIERKLEEKYVNLKKTKNQTRVEMFFDEIKKELRELPENDKISRALNLIEIKFDGITASETELQSLSSVKTDETTRESRREIRGIGERKQWLERRIDRHKEALAHWENEQKNEEG